MTKQDLADLCLEGLLETTEQQQQDQLAALLQVSLFEGVLLPVVSSNNLSQHAVAAGNRVLWIPMQAVREYQSDTFDAWRDLLEEQERRTRAELDTNKVLEFAYYTVLLQLFSLGCHRSLILMLAFDSVQPSCACYVVTDLPRELLVGIATTSVKLMIFVWGRYRLLWQLLRRSTQSCQSPLLMRGQPKICTCLILT